MLPLGPVSDFGVRIFGRQFYEQNEAVLLAACVVVFVAILYAIYQKLTYKGPHGIRRTWSKPPPHEEHEITRYREKSQNKT